MDQFFNFEAFKITATCSAVSSTFGVSDGREFVAFNVLSDEGDNLLAELGCTDPVLFRTHLHDEILYRLSQDEALMDAAKYYSPELFA